MGQTAKHLAYMELCVPSDSYHVCTPQFGLAGPVAVSPFQGQKFLPGCRNFSDPSTVVGLLGEWRISARQRIMGKRKPELVWQR